MAKRFFPEHGGDRKRAKLDISISDHNFPLSQNNDQNKDTWGDDNDDEILLLASQACEQAYTSEVSLLPDYSLCMQPGSTSTQMNPLPSTSRTEFTFKKPGGNPNMIISTHLKEKCNRISSPLPGITSNVIQNGHSELSDDDFIFSDQIFKGQDSNHTYKQLLQLQNENAKLKSENGKLLEKCVTKEGEASILRTQLKCCQVSVDNARLEKIKAQETVQMEWTDKLITANNQMSDLRTQLDFKNLEIISIKEKCKKLESTKVRLTQVTVANNDISASHRQSSSFHHESMTQSRRVKLASNSVQTEDKAQFMVLNKTISTEIPDLSSLLPLILEPSGEQHSLLEYNEKLSLARPCRVYTTFHQLPAAPRPTQTRCRVQLSEVYQSLTSVAGGRVDKEKYYNVFNAASSAIAEVSGRLDTITQRMSTAFRKEMDEKYIESTSTYLDVQNEDLLKGRSLFKEEQEISARRLIAMLAYILETNVGADMFRSYQLSAHTNRDHFLENISRICSALDNASCATLYSGLLLSITITIQNLPSNKITVEILKSIVLSRPMSFVVLRVLRLMRAVATSDAFCATNGAGNLKVDHEQGVLLYRKDSCHLQILLRQVEACLRCVENQRAVAAAVDTTRQLIILYNIRRGRGGTSLLQDKSRCDCQLVLVQVIVYALRICAVIMNTCNNECTKSVILPLCLSGVRVLYQCLLADAELSSALAHNEGHLQEFCEIMRATHHGETHANMLSELAGTLQSSPEDLPPAFHRQPWLKSFEQYAIAD